MRNISIFKWLRLISLTAALGISCGLPLAAQADNDQDSDPTDAQTTLRCQTKPTCNSKGKCWLEPKIFGDSITVFGDKKITFDRDVNIELNESKLTLKQDDQSITLAKTKLDNIICDGTVEQVVRFRFYESIFWKLRTIRTHQPAGCEYTLKFARKNTTIVLRGGRDQAGNNCQ